MKIKSQYFIITAILFMATTQLFAQRTVETYYDWGKTKLHEVYTTTKEPPYRKHGVYKEFDAAGNLIREKNFKDGKQHGLSRVFYFMPDEFQRECYGKLILESPWTDGKKHGWEKSWKCDKGVLSVEYEKYHEHNELLIEKQYYTNGNPKATVQLNGLCEEWAENGQKIAEYTQVDGVQDGKNIQWHSNGQLYASGMMANGKQTGEWKVYIEDGTLQKDVLIDPQEPVYVSHIEYYPNGNKMYDRQKTGDNKYLVKNYYESGNLMTVETQAYQERTGELEGAGLSTAFREDGNKIYEYINMGGSINGRLELYDENGEVVGGGEFVNGCRVGPFIMFYNEEGKEVFDLRVAKYKRDIEFDSQCKPTGSITDFYMNGNKKFEGKITSFDPETYDGDCIFYRENGNKLEERTYAYGTTRKITKYYEDGVKQYEASYSDNRLSGPVKYYDEKGTLRRSEYYNGGFKSGKWKYFSENGKLEETEEYNFDRLINSQKF